jgi:6-phosphofructokinase 2
VALEHGVYLAKPSLSEFRSLTGLPLTTLGEVEAAASRFVADQRAQLLVVSLGESGALLAHAQGSVYAPPLAVEVVSAVGAGDSFVAAMVWALAQGRAPEAAFAYGVAAGSAALSAAGTGLCAAADVHRLLPQVQCLPSPQSLAL